MQRKKNHRRFGLACGLAAAMAAGAALTAPAMAQTGTSSASAGPYRVMVHDLTHKTDAKSTRFGQRTAEAVRKGIGQMATHVAVSDKEVEAQLKALNVSKATFDCLGARQLAPRMNAEIVMCGQYEPVTGGTQVAATFYGKSGDETIEYSVPAFVASNENDAAEKIVQAFTGYVEQLRYVGFCASFLASEQWSDALRTCEQSLALNPTSAPSMYGRATALMKLDRKEEALAGFQKVLEAYPTYTNAMINAGLVAAQLGQAELSSKYFKDYLDLNPGDDEVRGMIAAKLNEAGDPAGAARMLEQGLAAEPDNYNLMRTVGVYYVIAGVNAAKAKDSVTARDMYSKALTQYEKVQANLAAAKLNKLQLDELSKFMILSYRNTGQLDKAIAVGRTAVSNDSTTSETWLYYADALAASKVYGEAKTALTRAAALDSALNVSYQLAGFAAQEGNLTEVVAMANKAASEGTPADQIDALAQTLIIQGAGREGDAALAWINAGRQIAKSDATSGMANLFEGVIVYKQGAAYVPSEKAPTASVARTAISVLQRARRLIQSSSAYTAGASQRSQYLEGIDKYLEYLQQIAKG